MIQTYSPNTILRLVSREKAVAARVGKCKCVLIGNGLARIKGYTCVKWEVCHRATVQSPSDS